MDILAIIEEVLRIFLVIFVCASEVFSCLLRVAKDAVEDTAEQPQLVRILLGDGLHDVVQLGQSLLVILGQYKAERRVERVLVDIERAETHIRQVSLATAGAQVVILRLITASRRLVAITVESIQVDLVIRELVLWIKIFALVHDAGALLKILHCLLVLSAIDLKYGTIQVKVLLVEDVFFVVIGVGVLIIRRVSIVTAILIKLIRFTLRDLVVQPFDFSVV